MPMQNRILGWLGRRPVLGSLLLGGGLFIVAAAVLLGRRKPIIIDAQTVMSVVEDRADMVGHDLSAEERRQTIDDYVEEEILVREAFRRGLHLTDGAARGRLIRKMRLAMNGEASEEELARMRAHHDIEVTGEMADRLAEQQATLLGRKLTAEERTAAVDAFIEEEILVREAYDQRVDIGDRRVRKTLVAASTFAILDSATERDIEPTAAEVAAHYEANGGRYAHPERLLLDWVSFLHGTLAPEDEEMVFRQLRRNMAPASVGGGLGQYKTVETLSRTDISRAMGRKFAAEVFDLEAGPWQGPLHPPQAIFYIRIRHRVPSEPRQLAEVESMVRNDLKAERFKAALREPLTEIATHYRITVQDSDEN